MVPKIPTDIFHVIDFAPLISNKVSFNVCEKIFQIFGQSAKKEEILQKFAFLCCDLTYCFLCYILAVASTGTKICTSLPFNAIIFHTHLIAMLSINLTVLVGQHLLLVVDHFLLKYL